MHRTPLHDIQAEAGGVAAAFGDWERIVLIGDPEAEAECAHNSAIIMDSSSFGKFSISGPDAANAIGRVITKDIQNLEVGRVTHIVSSDENGCVVDDGVVGRRSDNEYYLTTSTGRSALFENWMRKHCDGLGYDFSLEDNSQDLAAINIAGPRTRDMLMELTSADLSNDAFSFMSIMEVEVAGVPSTIMRIGFLGELGYEIHMPSGNAVDIWKALHDTGEKYGAETTAIMGMSHLRLEKGHIIPGHDIDGTATLFEAGLGFAWDRNHKGFVGEEALLNLEKAPLKRKLVRFKTEGRSSISPTSILMAGDQEAGRMPSVHYSRVLGQTIGISFAENHDALVTNGKAKIKTGDEIVEVDVIKGHSFFDP